MTSLAAVAGSQGCPFRDLRHPGAARADARPAAPHAERRPGRRPEPRPGAAVALTRPVEVGLATDRPAPTAARQDEERVGGPHVAHQAFAVEEPAVERTAGPPAAGDLAAAGRPAALGASGHERRSVSRGAMGYPFHGGGTSGGLSPPWHPRPQPALIWINRSRARRKKPLRRSRPLTMRPSARR